MDYAKESVRIFDGSWARQYREGDERAIGHGSRQHYGDILRRLCGSFGRKITVLDAGCGSGRYFHCLRKVERLVGIDISPHMLEQARNPIHRESLDIEKIELLCGDVRAPDLADESFDFIYSIGVVGEYSPVDATLLQRLHALLRPGGKLFLTVVDVHSRLQIPENAPPTLTLRALRKCFPLMSPLARKSLNRALSSHYVTDREVAALLVGTRFANYSITPYRHPSGWQGIHLDCLAQKGDWGRTVRH